jgi:hypothetical protein
MFAPSQKTILVRLSGPRCYADSPAPRHYERFTYTYSNLPIILSPNPQWCAGSPTRLPFRWALSGGDGGIDPHWYPGMWNIKDWSGWSLLFVDHTLIEVLRASDQRAESRQIQVNLPRTMVVQSFVRAWSWTPSKWSTFFWGRCWNSVIA